MSGDPAQDLSGLSPQGEVCGRRGGLGEVPILPGLGPVLERGGGCGSPGVPRGPHGSPVGNGQAGGAEWAPPELGAPAERALTVLF